MKNIKQKKFIKEFYFFICFLITVGSLLYAIGTAEKSFYPSIAFIGIFTTGYFIGRIKEESVWTDLWRKLFNKKS